MYQVKYTLLDKIRPLIDQAKDLEKEIHRSKQDQKAANWMVTAAKNAGLDLDEETQYELSGKLGSKGMDKNSDMLAEARRLEEFKHDDTLFRKRETKAKQKELALKQKYDREVQA